LRKRRKKARLLNKTPNTEKKSRERKCIVTGAVVPSEALIRFVVDPDGCVTPDLGEKLPGRGAWVSSTRALIETAASGGAFKRAFQSDVKAGYDLAATVEQRLRARALSALGLARRAGSIVTGFDQVGAVLREKKAAVLLTASDAADGGALKLARLGRDIPVIRSFAVEELSGALGREGIRHTALKERAETARFKRDILRFHRFATVNHETGGNEGNEGMRADRV